MATTFKKFKEAKRGNYCTLPTIDVEILPDTRHCETCGAEVVWDSSMGSWGQYVHVDGNSNHRPRAHLKCVYCNAEEGVVSRQYAWYDATECPRCGGVDGSAIGD